MTDSRIAYQTVANPFNQRCQLCDGLNSVFHSDSFEEIMRLPENIGTGYCKRIAVKPSVEISMVNMTFSNEFEIDGNGNEPNSYFDLSFYLGGSFRWQVKENMREFEAQDGENILLNGSGINSISHIKKGQHFSYLNLRMSNQAMTELLNQVGIAYSVTSALANTVYFNKNKTSLSMKQVLYDMMNCRLSGGLEKIYFEAKTMELFAIYMDEIIFSSQALQPPSILSKEDIECLKNAKNILDTDVANAPSLSQLAKMVYLNEFKLKTGFKELFGMSVHAYIIDRRLEEARFLLEYENLRVTEVARVVGYNELGRFAEKFRKKFGVNPSEYIKN